MCIRDSSSDAVLSEEHMLGTAEADALSTQVNCLLCVARVIGVGHDQQLTSSVCPAHEAVSYTHLNKTEGDHMTPAGTFPLAFVFSDIAQDTKMPFVRRCV